MPKRRGKPTGGESLPVDGSPTKDFFIHMLTRDIKLKHAIIDLVDNCIDGARRLRGNKPLSGLRIGIEATPDGFLITDNCGGIPGSVAKKYAFRFGRPEGAKPLAHSVGQFGVGMKRALFKLGESFEIRSTHAKFAFRLPVDVAEWSADAKTWDFVLRDVRRPAKGKKFAQPRQGTKIEVSALHPEVAEQFGLERFLLDLAREIAEAHVYSISRGLRIRLNGHRLKGRRLELLRSRDLAPAHRTFTIDLPLGKVEVRLYAGVLREPSQREDTHRAGWYIFCNDRLVLGADKTDVTGWIGGREEVPRYHAEYRYFRGYAFFDSDDPGLLPWTTTKSGVDESNASYRQARAQMIDMMQPVIGLLRDLKTESDRRTRADQTPIADALDGASPRELTALRLALKLKRPDAAAQAKPDVVNILYARPTREVERVKRGLGVPSARKAGEGTFDHYLRTECDD